MAIFWQDDTRRKAEAATLRSDQPIRGGLDDPEPQRIEGDFRDSQNAITLRIAKYNALTYQENSAFHTNHFSLLSKR